MEIQLHDIADPLAIAVATGSTGIVSQVMAYQMAVRTEEYPPRDLAEAMYIASTVGEMIQKMVPVEFIGVPDGSQEAHAEEEDD
jgi:TctA family transporter